MEEVIYDIIYTEEHTKLTLYTLYYQ